MSAKMCIDEIKNNVDRNIMNAGNLNSVVSQFLS